MLSGVPCNGDDDYCIDEISVTSAPAEQNSDAGHKPACPCSPFFACGTCHGVVVPNINVEFPQILQPVAKLQYFYTEQSLLDFPPSIWQPPQTA